jgi:uncharacterized protein (DUF433 family)
VAREFQSLSCWPTWPTGFLPRKIIRSYPSLTQEATQAALAYAAELAQERVLPLPA